MSTTVYVRGFDFGTTEEQINAFCAEAGTVEGVEMWGKGAAVVTYASKEEADNACKKLNRKKIADNKRYVDVKLNDDTKEKPKRDLPDSGGEGCRVFVRGFDFETKTEALEEHMSQAGTVERCAFISSGSAIVVYTSPEEAKNAAETMNKTTIPGNTRFIDVILKEGDDDGFPRGGKKRRTDGGGGADWGWMAKAFATMMSGMGGMGKGKGKGKW